MRGSSGDLAGETLPAEEFAHRLARLCIQGGVWELPKTLKDRHILFKSMQLQFDGSTSYSEAQVNERLSTWMSEVAPGLDSDVANLRRNLVDFGYLSREADGRAYRVARETFAFAADVEGMDPVSILRDARASREQRRVEQSQRPKKGTA